MAKSYIQGEWETMVRPLSDDLELPGQMGLTVTLTPEQAEAMGKTMIGLAQVIDAGLAAEYARKNLTRLVWQMALLVLALLLVAYNG